MNNNSKIINEHVRKEKIQSIFYIVLAVVPFILITLYFAQTGEVSEVKGVVTRLAAIPSDEGNNLYLIVKLNNNEKVRAHIVNTSFYRQGKTVILFKREKQFFGKASYKFKKYEK